MCNLRGHRAGRWSLHVRAAGFAFIPDRFTEYENGQEFAEVRLPMACTLDLELTDASGAPRSNVELCATTLAGELIDLQDRYGNYDGGYARSDASGHAVLVGLPAGRVHIVIGWKDGARLDLSADDATLLPANPLQCAVLDFDLVPGNRNKTKHLLR